MSEELERKIYEKELLVRNSILDIFLLALSGGLDPSDPTYRLGCEIARNYRAFKVKAGPDRVPPPVFELMEAED